MGDLELGNRYIGKLGAGEGNAKTSEVFGTSEVFARRNDLLPKGCGLSI